MGSGIYGYLPGSSFPPAGHSLEAQTSDLRFSRSSAQASNRAHSCTRCVLRSSALRFLPFDLVCSFVFAYSSTSVTYFREILILGFTTFRRLSFVFTLKPIGNWELPPKSIFLLTEFILEKPSGTFLVFTVLKLTSCSKSPLPSSRA